MLMDCSRQGCKGGKRTVGRSEVLVVGRGRDHLLARRRGGHERALGLLGRGTHDVLGDHQGLLHPRRHLLGLGTDRHFCESV